MGTEARESIVFRVRSPVRIDFAGGWSDVPEFADIEGGCVVNAAIALWTHVTCAVGDDRVIELVAEDLGESLSVTSPAELRYDGRLDLHKAALNMLPVPGGVRLVSSSDVPPGSGLGASGSLDVSLVTALAVSRGDAQYDTTDLAEMAFQLEAVELGLTGGRQDQYAAAFGGVNELVFGAHAPGVTRLDLSADAAADLERHLLLVYTGQSHFSPETHDRVWTAYREGHPDVTDAIRSMRDIGSAAAVALRAENWWALAEAVDDNWVHQQRLDPSICPDGLKRIERAAREAGAWGIKATGAGAGGCLLIVTGPDSIGRMREALASPRLTFLDCTFSATGVEVRHD